MPEIYVKSRAEHGTHPLAFRGTFLRTYGEDVPRTHHFVGPTGQVKPKAKKPSIALSSRPSNGPSVRLGMEPTYQLPALDWACCIDAVA